MMVSLTHVFTIDLIVESENAVRLKSNGVLVTAFVALLRTVCTSRMPPVASCRFDNVLRLALVAWLGLTLTVNGMLRDGPCRLNVSGGDVTTARGVPVALTTDCAFRLITFDECFLPAALCCFRYLPGSKANGISNGSSNSSSSSSSSASSATPSSTSSSC